MAYEWISGFTDHVILRETPNIIAYHPFMAISVLPVLRLPSWKSRFHLGYIIIPAAGNICVISCVRYISPPHSHIWEPFWWGFLMSSSLHCFSSSSFANNSGYPPLYTGINIRKRPLSQAKITSSALKVQAGQDCPYNKIESFINATPIFILFREAVL